MGNPKPKTPAYYDKLEKTKGGKQVVALKKLAKKPGVRFLVRGVRRADAAKAAEQRKELEEELQAKTLKANRYYRQLGPVKTQRDRLAADFAKQAKEVERLRAAAVEHSKEKQFWSKVKAQAHKGTLAWLERLRDEAPRQATRRRW